MGTVAASLAVLGAIVWLAGKPSHSVAVHGEPATGQGAEQPPPSPQVVSSMTGSQSLAAPPHPGVANSPETPTQPEESGNSWWVEEKISPAYHDAVYGAVERVHAEFLGSGVMRAGAAAANRASGPTPFGGAGPGSGVLVASGGDGFESRGPAPAARSAIRPDGSFDGVTAYRESDRVRVAFVKEMMQMRRKLIRDAVLAEAAGGNPPGIAPVANH